MEIIISGRHEEVTPEIKEYIHDKVEHALEHNPFKISSIRVILDLEKKHRHKAEILVNMKHMVIEADCETYDVYESIDTVIGKMERQIKHKADKVKKHSHEKLVLDETIDQDIDEELRIAEKYELDEELL